jgi:hypothetical protein
MIGMLKMDMKGSIVNVAMLAHEILIQMIGGSLPSHKQPSSVYKSTSALAKLPQAKQPRIKPT